jgi:hypothetical protein
MPLAKALTCIFHLFFQMAFTNFVKETYALLRVLNFLGWLPLKIEQEGGVLSEEWALTEIGYSIFVLLATLAISVSNFVVGFEVKSYFL